MSFSIKLGNFLYHRAFSLYKPTYQLFKRWQDASEIALLKEHVPTNGIVLDIGANIGFYAGMLSSRVGPSGKVYCFEPDVQNFKHLRAATTALDNVECVNKAVGPRTQTLTIYTSDTLNVDHRTYRPESFDQAVEIEAVSVDDFLIGAGRGPKVDFIKMDIQGFEMQAIQGMRQTLAHNPDIKLLSEFWPYGLRMAGNSGTEYLTFLTEHGFNVHLLDNRGLKQLDHAQVRTLEPLGKEHYFNIFATRDRV